jgi:fumarate reductase subunit C
MKAGSQYTLYHPRWYRRRMSVWWWLKSRPYVTFVLRELTSVFVAFFALVTLWQVWAIAHGPEAWGRSLERLGTPLLVALNLVTLVAVVFHSITWFNLTPKAMIVRIGDRRVPDALVVAANYAAWVVVSLVLAVILLRS